MIEHQITMTREQLQREWDLSCRLVERLTEAVKTLAAERDEARRQRDDLLAMARYSIDNNPILFGGSSLEACVSSVEKSVTNPSK